MGVWGMLPLPPFNFKNSKNDDFYKEGFHGFYHQKKEKNVVNSLSVVEWPWVLLKS